jgi:L-lactate dehydrogenase complex protein LldE
MHIEGALHRQRTGVTTLHLAEILAGEELVGLSSANGDKEPIL